MTPLRQLEIWTPTEYPMLLKHCSFPKCDNGTVAMCLVLFCFKNSLLEMDSEIFLDEKIGCLGLASKS